MPQLARVHTLTLRVHKTYINIALQSTAEIKVKMEHLNTQIPVKNEQQKKNCNEKLQSETNLFQTWAGTLVCLSAHELKSAFSAGLTHCLPSVLNQLISPLSFKPFAFPPAPTIRQADGFANRAHHCQSFSYRRYVVIASWNTSEAWNGRGALLCWAHKSHPKGFVRYCLGVYFNGFLLSYIICPCGWYLFR